MEDQDQDEQVERVVQDRPEARSAEIDDEVDVVEAEQRVQEGRGAVVDRGSDRDQAEQVEPAGEPRPPRAAELERPVVDPASSRYFEASSAIDSPTSNTSTLITGQPIAIAGGPPLFH